MTALFHFSVMAQFQTFGTPHLLAILATVVTAICLTRYARKDPDEKILKRIRYGLAGVLVITVSLDPVLTLLRYGTGSGGWETVLDSALPLYLCDVASLLLAYSLVTKSQRITEVGYLWGLAGTVQGLITPALPFDWTNLEFYVFFLQHGGVPVAAVFLVWGLHIVPEKGAFKRILFWSWGYMIIVISLNCLIGENYGFLNALPDFASPMDYMGDHPYYLITLQVVAFTFYFILLKIAPKPPAKEALRS